MWGHARTTAEATLPSLTPWTVRRHTMLLAQSCKTVDVVETWAILQVVAFQRVSQRTALGAVVVANGHVHVLQQESCLHLLRMTQPREALLEKMYQTGVFDLRLGTFTVRRPAFSFLKHYIFCKVDFIVYNANVDTQRHSWLRSDMSFMQGDVWVGRWMLEDIFWMSCKEMFMQYVQIFTFDFSGGIQMQQV